jgi:hypothetical protein
MNALKIFSLLGKIELNTKSNRNKKQKIGIIQGIVYSTTKYLPSKMRPTPQIKNQQSCHT